MSVIKKIVIVGPESTGKSTLCEKLANHYQTIWVQEYAREYLLKNGTDYTFENLSDVAKGQLANEARGVEELERKLKSENPYSPLTNILSGAEGDHSPLFIDTDMIVMKVWCEFVFDKCHNWILNEIVERKYDLYLLGNIDAPWVKDELREYPDLPTRERLYHHYKDIMVNQSVPWVDISGTYEERFQKAVTAVDELLKK
ncbi:MAG: ATP-binding protein [Chitinophagaceae bacterium]|nr:ATP-binding protein [Chitinophagaceae bacterium]